MHVELSDHDTHMVSLLLLLLRKEQMSWVNQDVVSRQQH